MAVTAKAIINEMIRMRKADITVREAYANIESDYEESKNDYKSYKREYEEKKEQLKEYIATKKDTPLLERKNINKKIKELNQKTERIKKKYNKAREEYKKSLKELRALKKTIRKQYKNCKIFEKFFSKLDEAEKRGIDIPRYIKIEAARQKSLYQRSTFSIDKKSGEYSYVPEPNMDCVRALASIIRERKARLREEKVKKLLENVIGEFSTPEGKEPEDM